MHDEEDLTPELRAALDALPRERDPGQLLEERVVHALRDRGVFDEPRRVRRFVLAPAWVTAAAAACLAIFAGGFSIGQWVANRQASQTLVALRQQDATQAAALVQQTGSAYLAALAAFANVSRTGSSSDRHQGQEVATNILHAAANEMTRINPDDPLTVQILNGLERASRKDSTRTGTDEARKVAWF
ncbi:MAG: hypothetical protein HOP12_00890 [Candidatus Eisenbacteria bacterium]|uniref:Uncharacterized protein n=1 Tax=Eiseniibacteriota bacterium TaxID=2212470 RepID=A0A849SII7_UNCEI|nr:hypothetical protein [Candidatus Eisenbacteria bacterium]